MLALHHLSLLATAALSCSAAPAPQGTTPPEVLNVAMWGDEHCSVLIGGVPSQLQAGVCYNITPDIAGLNLYTSPVRGGILSFWDNEDCCEDEGQAGGLSTEFIGCQKFQFEPKSIKYTHQ